MLERTYVIPLRKEWLKAPKYKRAKRAVNAVKTFLAKHMKSEDVRVGTSINLELWKHGIKNPPGRIKVDVKKNDENIVRAEMTGVPIVFEAKVEAEKGLMGKLKERVTGKKTEVPAAPTPESKIDEEKVEAAEKKDEVKKEGKAEAHKPKIVHKSEEKSKPVEKPSESKREAKPSPQLRLNK